MVVKEFEVCGLNKIPFCDLADNSSFRVSNVEVKYSINEVTTLSFDYPVKSPKFKYIECENLIHFDKEYYFIKTPEFRRDDGGKLYVHVECKHLSDTLASQLISIEEITPLNVIDLMKIALQYNENGKPTLGWKIGKVTVDRVACRGLEANESSPFSILLTIAEKYSGVLVFDSEKMEVNMYPAESQDHPKLDLQVSKNLKEISIKYDTTEMVTRMYGYGATNDKTNSELDFMSVSPDGLPYIENYNYFVARGYSLEYIKDNPAMFIRTNIFRDDNIFDAQDLYDSTLNELAKASKPTVNVEVVGLDMTMAKGIAKSNTINLNNNPYALKIGDCVRVCDKDINADYICNITSRTIDYENPHILTISLTNNIEYKDVISELYGNVSNMSTVVSSGGKLHGNKIDNINVDQIGDINKYYITAEEIQAKYATIENLRAEYITAETIRATYLDAKSIAAQYATISSLNAIEAKINKLNVDEVNAKLAKIDQLEANNANIKKLVATDAEIKDLQAQDVTIAGLLKSANAEIESLKSTSITAGEFNAYKATIEKLFATYATIEYLETNYINTKTIEANYAKVTELDAVKGNFDTLKTNLASVEELVAKKASIDDLNVVSANIDTINGNLANLKKVITTKVDADYVQAEIVKANKVIANKIDSINATIKNLDAKYATIEQLNVAKANLEDLIAKKATIEDLNAAKASIGVLDGQLANINSILAGNVGTGLLQTIHLTASNVVMDDAIIKSANIKDLDVSKLNAGAISTNKFTIKSDDGGIQIVGSTQQFTDKNGKVRLQVGKDAKGNFNFIVFGEDGSTAIYDQNGITKKAVPDGLIVDQMVSDNAGIQASKVKYIDKDGDKTLQTVVESQQGKITSLIKETEIIKEDFNNLQIGGRNLLMSTKTFDSPFFKKGNTSTAIKDIDGFYYVSVINTWSNYFRQNIQLEKDCKYCISFYAKATSNARLEIKDDGENQVILGTINIDSTTWKLFTMFFTCTNATNMSVISFLTRQNTATISIKKIKLELGNKPTDWTPAPEDLETVVTTLSDKYNQTVKTVEGNTTTIGNVKTTVDGHTNSIKSMTSSISQIKQTADGVSTTVTNNKSKWDKASTDATNANSKIDNLSIGGRNLLKQYIRAGGQTIKINDKSIKLVGNGKDTYFTLKPWVSLTKGETYTISFDASGVPDGCKWSFGVKIQTSSFRFYITKNGRISATGQLVDSVGANADLLIDDIGDRPSGAQNIILSNFKLEKGNKATDWTPAPEDVDNSISAVKTVANQTADKFTWVVKSGTTSTNFTLTDRTADLVAGQINLRGLVKFTGLDTSTQRALSDSKCLNTDVTFMLGTNGVIRYGSDIISTTYPNANVITRIKNISDSPTSSPYCLKVSLGAGAFIGHCGFVQRVDSRANAVFVQRFIAKLPIGYQFYRSCNNMGDGYVDEFVTNVVGTGKFTEYIRVTRCGTSGTFSNGGHVYVRPISSSTTAPTDANPVVFYLASCSTYDVTEISDSIAWGLDEVPDSDITLINGGMIKTKSITTSQLNVDEILAVNGTFLNRINAQELNADRITSGKITSKYIDAYGLSILDKDSNIETFSIGTDGQVMLRGSVESYDYVSGKSGWSINRKGSAEFNDVTVRGSVITGDGGIASSGGLGINLQKNTSFYDGLNDWDCDKNLWVVDSSFKYNGVNTAKFIRQGIMGDSPLNLRTKNGAILASQGETFTAQAMFYTDSYTTHVTDDDVTFRIIFRNNSNANVGEKSMQIPWVNKQWIRCELTGVAPSGTTNVLLCITTKRDGVYWVAQPKIERGDKATAWSLATGDKAQMPRFWAGASYANKEYAPFIVYNDGSMKATKGTFGGVFTGDIQIGNISIVDPSSSNGNDALVTISNGNNGIKAVQLTDTNQSSFAQNISITDNFYNENIRLTQGGSINASSRLSIGNIDDSQGERSILTPSYLQFNGGTISSSNEKLIVNRANEFDVGSVSSSTDLIVYGNANIRNVLKVFKEVNFGDVVKCTIASNGLDFNFYEGAGEKTYTVKWNTQGGSTIADSYAIQGKAVAKPTNPTYSDGASFLGWYKDKNCTQEWSFDYPVNSNITLYAKWEEPTKPEILASGTNYENVRISYPFNEEMAGKTEAGEDWKIGFVSGYKGKITSYKWDANLYIQYNGGPDVPLELEKEDVLSGETKNSVSSAKLVEVAGYDQYYVVQGNCIITIKLGNTTKKFSYSGFESYCYWR